MCGRLLGEEGKQNMKNGYAYDDSATVCFPLGWVLPQQEGRLLTETQLLFKASLRVQLSQGRWEATMQKWLTDDHSL